MQGTMASTLSRFTVAAGRLHSRQSVRSRTRLPALAQDEQFRNSRSYSGAANPLKHFANSHVATRTFSTTPKDGPLQDLFNWSRQAYPEKWRKDCWYLTIAAALIASGQQAHVGALYQHVLQTEQLKTPESRKHMVRRLREAMIKCVILNGIPKVMLAFHSLAAIEQEQDQDHSFTRVGWKADKENRAKGYRVLDVLYQGAQDKNHAACGAHKDIGCLRVGFTREEVDAVHKIIERIVKYGGGKLSQIGSVWDVEGEP